MGLEFIYRTLRTTGIVLLILFPFFIYYFGVWKSLALFSGGVWGMLNLWLITLTVRAAIRPEGVNKPRTIALLLFKFPLLYVSGYFLLKISQFQPLWLLAGAFATVVIMILKALGRVLLHLDIDSSESHAKTSGVA